MGVIKLLNQQNHGYINIKLPSWQFQTQNMMYLPSLLFKTSKPAVPCNVGCFALGFITLLIHNYKPNSYMNWYDITAKLADQWKGHNLTAKLAVLFRAGWFVI